ncbi:conserved hypothetical protein [Crocosphaera watsonii WH 8501]|uniref:Sll0756 protein n=3 Tax=Crocosphaera watsonii TaxID=263511 RepID=Q4C6P3_CROWT|nr:conserved hypothetical protein [Crocosphaera watsonii WH 8501]
MTIMNCVLNKKVTRLLGISVLIGINLLPLNIQPSHGQTCTAFPVVGGQEENETEVTKTVSQPSLPIPLPGPASAGVNNNWNTDFSIIPLKAYNKYIVTFTPKSDGDYKVRAYLKYNDNTADEIYNEQKSYTAGQPIVIEGVPKADNLPIQVNLFVGDPISITKTYTVSVKGCV